MKILLIEDDLRTADFIWQGLREHGHTVDHLADGREGLLVALSKPYDALVVDRMLPNVDGLTIVKTLRASHNQAPILILTTMDSIGSRVEGLGAGADDYLTKPFAFAELLARLMALSRRPPINDVKTVLQVADLEINLITREVIRAKKKIELQAQEFRLLEYLMRNSDQVVTRMMLLEYVWGFHFDPQTTVVETHISRLRAKVDKGFDTDLIHTLRGVGYMLREAS